MNGQLGIAILLVDGMLMFALPRRWAALPLLAGALYLPLGVGMQVGSFHFYAVRFLLVIALVRVFVRRESLKGPLNGLDKLMLLWAVPALASALFQPDVSTALVTRLGLVFTACGSYFVLRLLCPSIAEVTQLCRITAILLVPLAGAMLYETITGDSAFSALGANVPVVRNGIVRAQGAFAHPILAGSVGAACLPLAAALWREHWAAAVAGVAAALTIAFTSASSTPVAGVFAGITAMLMWRCRNHMRLLRWMAVLGFVGLEIVMNAPAYYVLTRIDLTGSSTSWHRAALIEAAINHLSEWWLTGTSYTRHWLPYGVPWSANHVDFTNHYLRMGVDGGLPLMLLFIAILAGGFSLVGRAWRSAVPAESGTTIWALGASLFVHATAFVSVSYFDQSAIFLYVTLAAIGSVSSHQPKEVAKGIRTVNTVCTPYPSNSTATARR
jgi:hypothetical protein